MTGSSATRASHHRRSLVNGLAAPATEQTILGREFNDREFFGTDNVSVFQNPDFVLVLKNSDSKSGHFSINTDIIARRHQAPALATEGGIEPP
ncbi:MAG: hypothetical protein ABL994_21625 [Verrucomicrobiales bacterium]